MEFITMTTTKSTALLPEQHQLNLLHGNSIGAAPCSTLLLDCHPTNKAEKNRIIIAVQLDYYHQRHCISSALSKEVIISFSPTTQARTYIAGSIEKIKLYNNNNLAVIIKQP